MVQKRQLREFRPEVRYRNLEITFDSIQAAISEKAEEFGIPVDVLKTIKKIHISTGNRKKRE